MERRCSNVIIKMLLTGSNVEVKASGLKVQRLKSTTLLRSYTIGHEFLRETKANNEKTSVSQVLYPVNRVNKTCYINP